MLTCSKESSSFAFVVIDGDGAVFREDLIAKGEEGGGVAAHILHKQLKEYFQEHPQFSGIDTIFVQVVLSVEGLSRALHASGTLPINDYAALTKFGRGFCRAQPLFSFIDVGYGKEQADHKIRKVFEVMEKNVQCKCLILGGCHDNGYATFLESFRGNDKICLLETTPPAADFRKFTFNRISFPEVFRSEPLQSKPTIPPGFSSTATSAAHHNSSISSSPSLNSPALTGSPKPSVATQVVSTSKSEAQPSSWAAVTVSRTPTTGPLTINIATQKKTSAPRAFMLLNKDDQRVDVPLPKADYNAVKSLDERSKTNGANFCNRFHLLNSCKNGVYCNFIHGERLNPAELLALRHKTRNLVCSTGHRCREISCNLGHHCASPNNCPYGNNCRFVEMHYMDTVSTSCCCHSRH